MVSCRQNGTHTSFLFRRHQEVGKPPLSVSECRVWSCHHWWPCAESETKPNARNWFIVKNVWASNCVQMLLRWQPQATKSLEHTGVIHFVFISLISEHYFRITAIYLVTLLVRHFEHEQDVNFKTQSQVWISHALGQWYAHVSMPPG